MVQGRSEAILIVAAVFLGISLTAFSLRLFVRIHIVKAFGWSDACMVAAMIFNLAFTVITIVGAVFGMGKRNEFFVGQTERFANALLCFYLGELFYVLAAVTARLSIILTLLRIAVTKRIHVWILYITITLSMISGGIFFFFSIFQCSPIRYFWRRLTIQGSCVDQRIKVDIVYMYSVVEAVCDLTISVLPVFILWNVRMDRQTKISVLALLMIGGVAGAAVIVRGPFLHLSESANFLYDTTEISIWSIVESSLGITAGSLMTLRPAVRLFKQRMTRLTSAARTAFPLPSHSGSDQRENGQREQPV